MKARLWLYPPRPVWWMAALMLCFSLLPPRLAAQDVTASVVGVVTDPSGAAVPGATISITDVQRGITLTAVTNSKGAYTIPHLQVGTYKMSVKARGFAEAKQTPFTLVLNQVAREDFALKVGQTTQAVTVTAGAPVLQTQSPMLGTVINARTNVSLPLATRNYVQLTLLAPGSVNPNPSTLTGETTIASAGRPYINGNREQDNNFLLDGMDNNQVSDNLVGYTPSVDAIQEFNLIEQNAGAQFGNYEGGIVNTTIKSGTNQFHGDLFEFLRNDKLNANNWANNFNGAPRPLLRWNMFGGTIGGPIIKNKLFFFGDYQGERFDHPATQQFAWVMPTAERGGDFSGLTYTDASGTHPLNIYDPNTTTANGTRTQFAGNIIPSGRIDPAVAALFNSGLYPDPNCTGCGSGNYTYRQSSHLNVNQEDVKVDFDPNQSDRFFARYSHSFEDNPTLNTYSLIGNGFNQAPTDNIVGDWTHTLGSNIVNDARLGVNYVKLNTGTDMSALGDLANKIGIAGGNNPGSGLPALQFSGNNPSPFTALGSSNVTQLFADTVIQFNDGLVITAGRHNYQVGFQYLRERVNTYYSGNNGSLGYFNFDGQYTAASTGGVSNSSGVGAADFLLGLPNDEGRGVVGGTWGQRANIISGYIQDDWRKTDNLTLNLGLRWEDHTPWIEVHDRQLNFSPISGAVEYAGSSNTPYSNNRALYNNYNGISNFQPRLGFAWTPAMFNGQTVIRGGYDISTYMEGTGTNLRLTMNPPFSSEVESNYTSLNYPSTTLDQGIPTVLPSNPFYGAVLRMWNPNVRPSVDQQWNLTVEHQLGKSTALQVGYVGQHVTHMMVPMPYSQLQLLPNGTTAPSPYLSGNSSLSVPLSQGIGTISGTESNGNMRYDALQATLKKDFSHGLQYQVAYTYGKCMTNSSGYYGSWGGQVVPTSPYWQNLYNGAAEWGPCYYDVHHVLTTYAVYHLPFGHGRAFGHNMNGVADAIVGGWNVSPIFTWRGGFPLTIWGPDNSGTNSRGARADCIAPPHVFGTSNPFPGGGYQWFDPNSYTDAAPGTFGTCGVGTVRGPGLTDLDLSLQKEFHFSESKYLQFRTEFINFTNTPILNTGWGTTWETHASGSQFGVVNSSQGERNIEFGLKLYF